MLDQKECLAKKRVVNVHLTLSNIDQLMQEEGSFDVVCAGVPCQPFSKTGKQLADADERNGFPVFVRALQCAPESCQAFLMENVENLMQSKHIKYFQSQLSAIRETTAFKHITFRVLNAALYNVPQKRKRLFVVGFRNKAHCDRFEWPVPNTKPALVEHVLTQSQANSAVVDSSLFISDEWFKRISKYEQKSKCKRSRDIYWQEPCRTLTCKNLANKTNDSIRIALSNGQRRLLTVEEAYLLQTLPKEWFVNINRTSAMQMIGNSVPCALSSALTQSLINALL